MKVELLPYISEYESFVAKVDAAVLSVAQQFESHVACRLGCSDCCHALFDITFVEAIFLNMHFLELPEAKRTEILIEADKADRKAQVLKRRMYRDFSADPQTDILSQVAAERIRCPLLNTDNSCTLYQWRPLTCRVYGIPMEIGGKSHTCGLSGFDSGQSYPTIKVEKIQDQLVSLSNQMLVGLGCNYQDFQFMHVPVSTALLTVYNDKFFGRTPLDPDSGQTEQENSNV